MSRKPLRPCKHKQVEKTAHKTDHEPGNAPWTPDMDTESAKTELHEERMFGPRLSGFRPLSHRAARLPKVAA